MPKFDGEKRQLRYVSAGQNPPYLLRALDSPSAEKAPREMIEELATGGIIIGMFSLRQL